MIAFAASLWLVVLLYALWRIGNRIGDVVGELRELAQSIKSVKKAVKKRSDSPREWPGP